jgi:hypothetical protein
VKNIEPPIARALKWADAAVAAVRPDHHLIIGSDFSPIWPRQPCDDVEQCGFAAAARTDEVAWLSIA